MAYDVLKDKNPGNAGKEYLKILHYAAQESESGVDDALRLLFDQDRDVNIKAVKDIVLSGQKVRSVKDVSIDAVNLEVYDCLLSTSGVA